MADDFIDLELAAVTAAGTTTPRTFKDRFSDVINVLDFGADPTFANDSYGPIQAALDLAFGPASNPHGAANKHLNRPVFIPNGNYRVTETLKLTRVVGGHIFGAGPQSTQISRNNAPPAPTFASTFETNGCAGLVFERIHVGINLGTGFNSAGISLDWDNAPGGDGLHFNCFRDCAAGGNVGILIARSGNGGADNLFVNCTMSTCIGAALEARGPQAINNMTLGGGGASNGVYALASGGSLHIVQASTAGNGADLRVDSAYPSSYLGGRSEGPRGILANNGLVLVRGLQLSGGGDFVGSIAGTTLTFVSGQGLIVGEIITGPGVAPGTKITAGSGSTWTVTPSQTVAQTTLRGMLTVAEVNGGKVTIDAVQGSSALFLGAGGTLYLRGCSIEGGNMLTNYTGTVAQNI